jgi:hypothetical protein
MVYSKDRRSSFPSPEPKPDLKPVQMEAKVALPVIKPAKPAVIWLRSPRLP